MPSLHDAASLGQLNLLSGSESTRLFMSESSDSRNPSVLLTYFLLRVSRVIYTQGNFTGQSPSREADSRKCNQEISGRLWNPMLRYFMHKRLLLDHILSLINPIHTLTSTLLL